MTKKKLLALLANLPDSTEVYVRVGGDDAWPARATAFKGEKGTVVYLGPDPSGAHRNYPEWYSGAEPVKLP